MKFLSTLILLLSFNAFGSYNQNEEAADCEINVTFWPTRTEEVCDQGCWEELFQASTGIYLYRIIDSNSIYLYLNREIIHSEHISSTDKEAVKQLLKKVNAIAAKHCNKVSISYEMAGR